MHGSKDIFLEKSKIAFDRKHRKTINYNISQYDAAVIRGKARYTDYNVAKEKASSIKDEALCHLASYLLDFEKNITSRGAEVVWARTGNEALEKIEKILLENKIGMLVKSKSMISEEIGLNEHLEKLGIEPVETDLGEFIVQQAGEKPYHILTPAMHKSRADVARLFQEKFDTPADASALELAHFARKHLRKKFTSAQVGITGANFLIADIGAIGLTENEGNALMSVSFPKIHIVLAGIERVIPSVKEMPFFFPFIASGGTGQQISVYNSLITGPRQEGEPDGPERLIVVLLDNGRSDLYNQGEQAEALKCIRCGACLNACPIYKNIGGYTYNSTYTGPIGSVITPFYNGFREYAHLSYACTLCGRCSEVCSVKIPLHYLLLLNRKIAVDNNYQDFSWKVGMKVFESVFLKREKLDLFGGKIKNTGAGLLKPLGENKKLPDFAKQSFSKQWQNNTK